MNVTGWVGNQSVLRVILFFRVIGGPVHDGPRSVLGAFGGIEQQYGYVGEELLHLGQLRAGASRQHALRTQGAFQGLSRAVVCSQALERGRPKGAANTAKVGYVLRE